MLHGRQWVCSTPLQAPSRVRKACISREDHRTDTFLVSDVAVMWTKFEDEHARSERARCSQRPEAPLLVQRGQHGRHGLCVLRAKLHFPQTCDVAIHAPAPFQRVTRVTDNVSV